MRAIVVIALVALACGKSARDGKWAPITRADLVCKSDADCTTRGHDCCSGCGGSVGYAMNAARAAKDDHARPAICRDVKCPDLDCEAPTCWDEGEAFCDRGACSLRIVKRGNCAPDGIAQICRAGTCTSPMATVVVWRDASGAAKVLQFHGGLDRCSHPPMVYYDPGGKELGAIPEQPVVPGSPEAKGFEETHAKLTAGLRADPQVHCSKP